MQTVKKTEYLVIIMSRDEYNKKWIATYEDEKMKVEIKAIDGDAACRECARIVEQLMEELERPDWNKICREMLRREKKNKTEI